MANTSSRDTPLAAVNTISNSKVPRENSENIESPNRASECLTESNPIDLMDSRPMRNEHSTNEIGTSNSGESTHQEKNRNELLQPSKIKPFMDLKPAKDSSPNERGKTNLNEVYVIVPITLDPANQTAVASVLSVLKAKKVARQKTSKQQPKFHPKVQALLDQMENDDDFDGSPSNIEEALR